MKFDLLVGDRVGSADRGWSRVVVMKFPRDDRAVLPRAALDFNDAGRPEVGPGELLLARPDDLDRFSGRLGQARRLYGRVARVLAAVGGSGVWDENADALGGNVESLGQLFFDRERTLRSSPDGELLASPFGHRSARFEWRMRDVSDGVTRRELDVGPGARFAHRAGRLCSSVIAALPVLLQIVEELLIRRLRRNIPFAVDR